MRRNIKWGNVAGAKLAYGGGGGGVYVAQKRDCKSEGGVGGRESKRLKRRINTKMRVKKREGGSAERRRKELEQNERQIRKDGGSKERKESFEVRVKECLRE